MISSTTPNSFVISENIVEPVLQRAGEDDLEALARMILDRSVNGWEIIDVCGDEIRQPVIAFRKVRDPQLTPRYTMERFEVPSGQDEVTAINDRLWQRLATNWLPACIIDSLSTPIIVYRKCYLPVSDMQVKLVTVPVSFFEYTATALLHDLVMQQVKSNLTLACIMHGGLNPALVLITKQNENQYQYAVEHAFAGVFSNQRKTLDDLIEGRTNNGWEACGMFEDSFISPCVVFRRVTDSVPAWPGGE